jgi:A/G-specific adenine glycosylase
MNSKKETYFTQELLQWNKNENRREMPWKGEKDPYKIWLSEIILQQTRVEQGLGYYNRFVQKFPSVDKLANAPETAVFKLWEGLGYYSRCKNLAATAKFISKELKGKFPATYEEILKLKGVGPYTASAIASFAYNLPHAVVDGNVMRVLARYFGISTAIDSTEGKKYFSKQAEKLLDKKQPGLYNQAIMDFGATVCKPQQPLCSACILKQHCSALKKNIVQDLPVKEGKLVKKHRWFYYIIAEYKNGFIIRKRTQKDIWQNLHEFILMENDKALQTAEIFSSGAFEKIAGKKYELISVSGIYKQQLTHQTIHGWFIHIRINKKTLPDDYVLIEKPKLKELAFPRLITTYFMGEGHGIYGYK